MSTASHLEFRKSSYSQGARENCVEVAEAPGASAVRDSQHPGDGHLMFPIVEWGAFLATVRDL
ncbi:DUF397 domain-containing protein [Nocardiopsis suaedae]|uniref:DUF397 domain-containing protein n=1 Tax=Nocardiopsis suaedae TaxID=3018444 RepID=A0ABT4TJ77_9ACTN|nr:DUF397 domain-containing protein [Nocardiopsis suaedae]MDA2804760.1 DUF397 domain-containing protein [Nocardiopsis suaedae]